MRAAIMSVGAIVALIIAGAAHADPIRVYAAGSLARVMPALEQGAGVAAENVFGPAGLLRRRIEGGEHADLYLSADQAQPEALAKAGRSGGVVAFARNRLCLVTRAAAGVTQATMLDRMLDPAVRLAISTPGADPGGDYAWAAFARAEAVHPGARAALEGKAMQLFGGPTVMVPAEGHTPGGAVLLAGRADAVLYYCSGAAEIVEEVPDTVSTPLLPWLEVRPVYALTMVGDNAEAGRLALFALSEAGQAILEQHGLLPVLSPPEPDRFVKIVQRVPVTGVIVAGGGEPRLLTMEALRAMPAGELDLAGEHGAAMHVRGPTLWAVLQQAGAVNVDVHQHVRQVIVATGNDGYVARVAMGEVDPAFEGKAVMIATERDGAPLDRPRLIVPGDKRLGRDVRDLAELRVE